MTITKSTHFAGFYECFGYCNGEYFVGMAKTKAEALDECFKKIIWAFN